MAANPLDAAAKIRDDARMLSLAERLVTLWISRRAAPLPGALSAVKGRVPAVAITGGGSGIGRAIAEQFAARGHAVVLIGRRLQALEAAAAAIRQETGARAVPLACDVTAPSAAEAIDQGIGEAGLYCDILVNSAGSGLSGPFEAQDPAGLDTLIAVNVAATTRLTRAFLPQMLARGRGGIITVGSLGGFIPGPHQAAYYASKAYGASLSEALASEMSGRGVRIAVVTPGPVETRFHARMGAIGARYRALLPSTSADSVARATVRGYKLGRRVIAPGAMALAPYALRVLPHTLTVPITGWLLGTPRRPPKE